PRAFAGGAAVSGLSGRSHAGAQQPGNTRGAQVPLSCRPICGVSRPRAVFARTMQPIETARAPGRRAFVGTRALTTHPIDQDIQKVRLLPAVRAIVIPPCPESLLRLQAIVAAPDLDPAA